MDAGILRQKGKEEKDIRAEAAKVLLEGKYLQALGKILMENRNRSVSDAYSNLKTSLFPMRSWVWERENKSKLLWPCQRLLPQGKYRRNPNRYWRGAF